jgi:hypothetical protein
MDWNDNLSGNCFLISTQMIVLLQLLRVAICEGEKKIGGAHM